tara:strand:+ start:197 stop:943 length:747 start_codon:yes stop_codon:yes gene_type:complete
MLKVRIIPILTFDGLSLVKTKQFKNPRIIGNPIQAARVYNSRNVDELVFIDIMATKESRKINLGVVKKVIDECFMPVTIGGGITSFEDIKNLLNIGADKVLIKTKAINDFDFIKKSVGYFGSQCISISMDIFKHKDIYKLQHTSNKNISLIKFIQIMKECKVGEFVINSIDNDGMMKGFDIVLMKELLKKINTPIIIVGGAGKLEHFTELYQSNYNGAVGASSIYHFTQFTPKEVKLFLNNICIPVRI